jgi:predicted tellurium resistance membrane protein TerC
MALLTDPQAWVSFLMLAVLEIVLGVDNIILLAILVDRLPPAQRARGRVLGLSFAMLTRIALLFSVVWLATMRRALFALYGHPITGRDLILAAGGVFLIVMSIAEIRETIAGRPAQPRPRLMSRLWLVIAQVGVIDIVFSLDSVFTAVGLANRIEVMIAAIVASVLVMMAVSSAVSSFIDRYPSIKVLALGFLVVVGAGLIAESANLAVPKGCLYFALAFSAAVEWLNIRMRRRIDAGGRR